jgi:peptidoglycan/xylan/chitin deacetylase (PgdA/CDA1 family)
MTRWLDPVRASLDNLEQPATLFFRDDDAGWDDPALARLLQVFERHQVVIDLAVIPDAVSDRLVALVQPALATGGVRVHQHGYRHLNHEVMGRKCEFGPSRRPEEQRSDLATGATLLVGAFGDAVDPIFTPPWNRCTPTTIDLLAELGYLVLSRHTTTSDPPPKLARPNRAQRGQDAQFRGVRERSVSFDWFGRTQGTRWDPAERGRRLAASLRQPGPVGVMLHHAVTEADELAAIDELVALVSQHRNVLTTTILAEFGVPPA